MPANNAKEMVASLSRKKANLVIAKGSRQMNGVLHKIFVVLVRAGHCHRR
jgi:hypothetical protein